MSDIAETITKIVEARMREQHEQFEAQIRAMAPLAGRTDCEVCHGMGGYIVIKNGVYEAVERCTCTVIDHDSASTPH